MVGYTDFIDGDCSDFSSQGWRLLFAPCVLLSTFFFGNVILAHSIHVHIKKQQNPGSDFHNSHFSICFFIFFVDRFGEFNDLKET